MKKVVLGLVFMMMSVLGYAQDITKGTWFNEEKTAKVQFYKVGDKTFGKVVWLKEPTKDGKPRTDEFNPDAKKRSTPLIGLVNFKNFKQVDSKKWEDGTIYDPKTGKTYSCIMTLENPNKINARGYIGISLIGKTTVFTRASE